MFSFRTILLDKHGAVKIADLGLAGKGHLMSDDTPARQRSASTSLDDLFYFSPEMVQAGRISPATDIWYIWCRLETERAVLYVFVCFYTRSFGCIVYELMRLRRAFEARSVLQVCALIAEARLDQPLAPHEPSALKCLVEK